ncbi:MAG TPA: DUF1015 domain-containing protein [Methylomirabilota bacterium]|nr:DUF1015 domain-containing protein [Methylomirabilota bacterium]
MNIKAFRGYRHGGGERDLTKVVAPPYDQITPAMQAELYALHPANIVRVSFPRDDTDDKYARARETLDRWLAEGVWVKEEAPAIYPYQQTYRVGDRTVTRTGVIALGEVTEYARGIVLPHERTHAGPKRDRMRLLEATGADLGLLFMLTSDPTGEIMRVSAPPTPPIAEARDLRGELHRLWRVTDPEAIGRLHGVMAEARVIIADGHHRYETAVEYARRHPEARDKLMAFFPLEAPGLTILPNHRLVHGVEGFAFPRFLEAARRWFDVAPLPDPLGFRPTPRALAVASGADAVVLALRDEAFDRLPWPSGTSQAWRRLAVSILHEGLLRPLLEITDAKLDARTHVDYTADQAEAVALARAGRYQAAFLIAPTTPEELQAVVRGGERLPQKSTHFYPKLLDGLVFSRLGEE